MEVLYERCCGLDVHKSSIAACILLEQKHRPKKHLRRFGCTTRDLLELVEWLRSFDVQHVAMESTGVYWKPVWNVLEEHFQMVLPLVLAGCAQLHISPMQPVLRLPRNLLGLFRDALLSSAQSVPDPWRTTIAPCSFDNDASQVRVAGLRDASASGSLTAGILRLVLRRSNP